MATIDLYRDAIVATTIAAILAASQAILRLMFEKAGYNDAVPTKQTKLDEKRLLH